MKHGMSVMLEESFVSIADGMTRIEQQGYQVDTVCEGEVTKS